MRIFDTHAHLTDARFDDDRDELIARLPEAGVELVCDVACDLRSTDAALELIEKHGFIFGAVGMHPHTASFMDGELTDKLYSLLKHRKMLALGEIGLDYHYDLSPREVQKEWFDKQLSIAEELHMPVILHIREAMGDCLDILRAHRQRLSEKGGIMHCYSGSAESARECLDLGLYIGIGGSLTFKNNRRGVETAAYVPLDRIVFETDCPYMAPVPHRGERNDPTLIPLVIKRYSEITGIDEETAAEAAFINGCRVLGVVPPDREPGIRKEI
ncbi:MAG: TatD family hydrolase [Clostridia bacterium]|nr:TatD family hydrolase [Clostridia bacterium]